MKKLTAVQKEALKDAADIFARGDLFLTTSGDWFLAKSRGIGEGKFVAEVTNHKLGLHNVPVTFRVSVIG